MASTIIILFVCCVQSLGCVQLFVALWTVVHQALLTRGYSRQDYWSGVPFPPLGDLPDPDTESVFLVPPTLTGRFFTIEPFEKPPSFSYRVLIHQ